jgi:hypothetical protein
MRKSRQVLSILREKGPSELYKFFMQILRKKLSGGYSSRERIELVAGLLRPFFNGWFILHYGRGEDVINADWDNLVILDACRYDDFETINGLNGDLNCIVSKGADSPRFMDRTFRGRNLHDTIYVTANPHVSRISDNVFFVLEETPLSEWDSDRQCIPPEAVTEAAIEAHKSYPNKRIIAHYMQPHDPPIGPTGSAIREEFDIGGPAVGTSEEDRERIMRAVSRGKISLQRARKAYRETLDIALDEAARLHQTTNGKTVITADHGEHFGESVYPLLGRLYEHFGHPRTPELCVVPWFEVEDYDNRREVTENTPRKVNRIDRSEITDQLEALGYK